jgi:hypothetical protein
MTGKNYSKRLVAMYFEEKIRVDFYITAFKPKTNKVGVCII